MTKLVLAATLAAAMLSSFAPAPAQAQSNYPCTAGPNCPNEGGSTPDRCGEELGHLKRVYPAEVLGVSEHYRVWITELCPTSELMRSDGNAAYLRTAIADNEVLVDALDRKGYFSDDVFAVRMMGDDTIGLYVHRFDDRR